MARLTDRDLVAEIERTYFEGITDFYARGSTTRIEREDSLIVFRTGLNSPMLNGVLSFAEGARSAARVRSLVEGFQNSGIPMMWVTGPGAPSGQLDSLMAELGMAVEPKAPGMALELDRVESASLPPGLEIEVASDLKDQEICTNISAEVFGIPPDSFDGWRDMVHGYGLGPSHRWFIGRLDGEAVAISLLVMHDKVAGVYNVATLEKARGKGIGSALTREPLLFAKKMGYDVAVLEASEMGYRVYEKLGFRTVCEFSIYVWMPGMKH